MATLGNTTVNDTGQLVLASGTSAQRTATTATVQSYTTVTAGTVWTCPSDVSNIDILVYAGGGGGGGTNNAAPGGAEGGKGGGGRGGDNNGDSGKTAGTDGLGGGGGGSGGKTSSVSGTGAVGGCGCVIIKYYANTATVGGHLRLNSDVGAIESYEYGIGWKNLDQSYNEATGGTITSFGGWKTHFFTSGSATFTPKQSGIIELLIVAGGGGGSGFGGGGSGGGGVLYVGNYPVEADVGYAVVCGAGGTAGPSGGTRLGGQGGNSSFGTLIAIGGGYGANDTTPHGQNGGSGGGGGTYGSTPMRGGAGVTGQGFNGGTNATNIECGAGGGGAGAVGETVARTAPGGNGGAGYPYNTSGQIVYYGGGGGGGLRSSAPAPTGTGFGGLGGNGGGGRGGSNIALDSSPGMPGTGGGGGGQQGYPGGVSAAGTTGGSGIVIARYRTSTIGDGSTSATAAPSARAIKQLTNTTTDGLYWIYIPQVGATQVYCDMNTDGGGWMHCGTFSDGGEATNNAAHIWGAPMGPFIDTGIWENFSTSGTQSFTADFKSPVWCYMPFRQMLMKDSGATLRNIWQTSNYNGNYWDSMSRFWQERKWLADGSDGANTAYAAGRVYSLAISNFGVNDPVFNASGMSVMLFKWGERNGVQDGNKDRTMIASHRYDTGDGVDSPAGIGCFTDLGGTLVYRDIVPFANRSGDSPASSISGAPHNLTYWVR